jgi:alkanesulfonate monooxygenase SsuD/methylene tetrahydromethanopterin reductase-like flavin-dependent oxidoreductase (luciferase family)
MRFGLVYGFVAPPQSGLTWADAASDFVATARRTEELGYDVFQVIEHHFQPDGHNPSPLLTLAAAAAATEQIRLATNILLVPLYNPVKLAEDVAVLDNLSNGRLTLGVAPGYVREEFDGLMVPYDERFKRYEEALDVMQAAWTNETFSFDGQFYKIPETRLSPKPVQAPHPPLWYGVSGPRLLRLAAKRHCVLTASPRHTITELEQHFATYTAHAEGYGYTPTERPVMRGTFIAETREKAEEIAAPAITHLFRELYGKQSAKGARELRSDDGTVIDDHDKVSFETFKDRYIVGTPDDACRQIEELQERIGMTELTCWMQLPGVTNEAAMKSAELFAREVIPAFSAAGAKA